MQMPWKAHELARGTLNTRVHCRGAKVACVKASAWLWLYVSGQHKAPVSRLTGA